MQQIPMSSKLAGWLVTFATFAASVGAFILSADEVPFGWDAYNVGLSLVWAGAIANFAVVAIRRNAVPGITTGIGTEPAVTTETSSVSVTKTTTPPGEGGAPVNNSERGQTDIKTLLIIVALVLAIIVLAIVLYSWVDVEDDPTVAIDTVRALIA